MGVNGRGREWGRGGGWLGYVIKLGGHGFLKRWWGI